MKHNFSKAVYIYYVSVLVSIIIMVSGAGYYFWDKGAINVDNVSSIFEANLITEQIQEKDDLKVIKNYVDNDRVREAVSSSDKLERKLKIINSVITLSLEYGDLKGKLTSAKGSLNNLLSFPELRTIFKILAKKISSFNRFVVKNNWRTLTRISLRLEAKLNNTSRMNTFLFNYKRISSLYWKLNKDINYMKSVTENSVLLREDKNIILTKNILMFK